MGQLIRSDAYSGIGNFDYDLIRRMKGADGNDILLKSRGENVSGFNGWRLWRWKEDLRAPVQSLY